MSVSIIEKDYWVCFILDYLFSQSKFKDFLTFKGGTSLSKGFDLIHRFSEDVDLILDWRIFEGKIADMNDARSKNQQSKYNKKIGDLTQEFLKNTFIAELKSGLKKITAKDFDIQMDSVEKQVVNFFYPKLNPDKSLLSYVRLEIGSLAALDSCVTAKIKPYVFDYAPKPFIEESVAIRMVSPQRTFWEKATILYKEALRPKEKAMPKRYSRHYYDLYQLSRSKYKELAVNDSSLLKQVTDFKQKFYPESSTWLDYRNAIRGHFVLIPPSYRMKELENDYKKMQEMIYGQQIPLTNIMQDLKMLEDEINFKK